MRYLMILFGLVFLFSGELSAQGTPKGPTAKLTGNDLSGIKFRKKLANKQPGIGSTWEESSTQNKSIALACNNMKSGNIEAAIDTLTKYSGSDNDAAYGLACCYYKQGKPDEAIKIMQPLCNQNPVKTYYLLELAWMYETKKEFAKAEECYMKIISKDANQSAVWYGLGYIYTMIPELLNHADFCFSRVLGIDPKDPDAAYELCLLAAAEGDLTLALNKFEQALRNGFWEQERITKDWQLTDLRKIDSYKKLMEQYFK